MSDFLCPNTSLAKDFKMQMSHWKMLIKRLRIDFYSPRPLTALPFCVAVPVPASREKYPQCPFQSSPSVGVGDPNYCPGENIPNATSDSPLLWGRCPDYRLRGDSPHALPAIPFCGVRELDYHPGGNILNAAPSCLLLCGFGVNVPSNDAARKN